MSTELHQGLSGYFDLHEIRIPDNLDSSLNTSMRSSYRSVWTADLNALNEAPEFSAAELGDPHLRAVCREASLEATRGQMDGFFSQPPHKVASVGD